MKTSDFDYDLPPELIAQFPVEQRDRSRLLYLPSGEEAFADHRFFDLPELLAKNDIRLLVLNNTKVIAARLFGRKSTGGNVELLLLEPGQDGRTWTALSKSSKPLKRDSNIFLDSGQEVTVSDSLGQGRYLLDFQTGHLAAQTMDQAGVAPLPPYIRRNLGGTHEQRSCDRVQYQTIYAKNEGAIAAPTAGLHFTESLFLKLKKLQIETVAITLHVGEGTFAPVHADMVENHKMHTEWYEIRPEVSQKINRALARGERIAAVGTTSCRTLESAVLPSGEIRSGSGRTDLFITPGYKFKTLSALVTNFHLPKSTLLMLVSALAGKDRILAAYRHAINEGYRFYSYGDAMLIV